MQAAELAERCYTVEGRLVGPNFPRLHFHFESNRSLLTPSEEVRERGHELPVPFAHRRGTLLRGRIVALENIRCSRRLACSTVKGGVLRVRHGASVRLEQ